MEDAIRDVFPYGPAELIVMYTAALERKELHEELLGKISNGVRLITHRTWGVYGVIVKNGHLSHHISRSAYNKRNFCGLVQMPDGFFYKSDDDHTDDNTCGDGRITLFQSEYDRERANARRFIFTRPPSRYSVRTRNKQQTYPLKEARLTRQLLIDYLTNNGFKGIKSKTKPQLLKLSYSF